MEEVESEAGRKADRPHQSRRTFQAVPDGLRRTFGRTCTSGGKDQS